LEFVLCRHGADRIEGRSVQRPHLRRSAATAKFEQVRRSADTHVALHAGRPRVWSGTVDAQENAFEVQPRMQIALSLEPIGTNAVPRSFGRRESEVPVSTVTPNAQVHSSSPLSVRTATATGAS
jgi:hypothetical protein